MNGQDPNIQGNQNNLNNDVNLNPNPNNNSMDSMVLGNVNTAESLNSTPNIEVGQTINVPSDNATVQTNGDGPNLNMGQGNQNTSVDSSSNIGTQPQAQPIPNIPPINNASSTLGVDPVNSNGFVEPQKVENIGTVPPPEEPKKDKKLINKVLFVLLILALIGAVAYGVYYYLTLSKNSKVKVTPREVTVSLGDELSTSINDYATIIGTDPKNCALNGPEKIDTSNAGEYEYTITCGKESFKGKIIVEDKSAPKAELKVVYVPVNGNVKVDDFIDKCNDGSECKYAFVDEVKVNNYLVTAGGPYSVEINVSDSTNNSTTVEGVLYVVPYDIVAHFACSSPEENITTYKAARTVTDSLAIGSNGTIVGYLDAGRREYKYVFEDEEEYKTVIDSKDTTITFDGHKGLATYDDEKLTLTISTDLDKDTLNSEANGTFPPEFQNIRAHYEAKGYTCQTR